MSENENQDVPLDVRYGKFQCRGCQDWHEELPGARWSICHCGTVYDRRTEESMPYDQWVELEGAWAFKQDMKH